MSYAYGLGCLDLQASYICHESLLRHAGISRGLSSAGRAATWVEQLEVLLRNIEKRQVHTGSVKHWLHSHHPPIPGGWGTSVPEI